MQARLPQFLIITVFPNDILQLNMFFLFNFKMQRMKSNEIHQTKELERLRQHLIEASSSYLCY